MSATQTAARAQTKTSNTRRNANRGKRGNQAQAQSRGADQVGKAEKKEESASAPAPETNDEKAAPEESTEDVCWICAEPVKYYSLAVCNHRTCHVCALRLRALYKKTDCAFCKEAQPSVIFTTSADAPFDSFSPASMTFKDSKLSIFFETQDMMVETLLLLRFNCPDTDCVYTGRGWGDLKLHVRAMHGKLMCDLCIRSKKVFAHEHALYPPNLLPVHLPSMFYRSSKAPLKDQIEGGVHPLCEFCRECFFGDDELYAHLRERHEECFLCKRNGVRDQYFQNYENLEYHFNRDHYPCTYSACLARKFVVFNTTLDLKAHMVDEHGGEMTSRDRKDARRINAEFEFDEIGIGGRNVRRDRSHREPDREQPPRPVTVQQQEHQPPSSGMVRPPGPGRRRNGFGTTFTAEGAENPVPNSNSPQHSRPSTPSRGDVDPALTERHDYFISRLQSLTANQPNAVAVVKAGVRGYRASESTAKDLILTVWNVLDQNLENTASIINALVDLLDLEDKKQDLLASWRGFTIEQRRRSPDLVPTNPNAAWAAVASGRVLNAKHITATRSRQGTSRQVWDRVAQAAASSHRSPAPKPAFPSLLSSSSSPGPSSSRSSQRNTPWASNASRQTLPPVVMAALNQSITVVREDPRGFKQAARPTTPQAPPKLNNVLFPELQPSTPRPKAPISGNASSRNLFGSSAPPAVSVWGGEKEKEAVAESGDGAEGQGSAGGSGKGKKGKGKQKQTLFTIGSFPS